MSTIHYVIRREDRVAAGLYAINHSDPYRKGYRYTDSLEEATVFPTASLAADDLETRMAGYYATRAARFVIVPVRVQQTRALSLFGY